MNKIRVETDNRPTRTLVDLAVGEFAVDVLGRLWCRSTYVLVCLNELHRTYLMSDSTHRKMAEALTVTKILSPGDSFIVTLGDK